MAQVSLLGGVGLYLSGVLAAGLLPVSGLGILLLSGGLALGCGVAFSGLAFWGGNVSRWSPLLWLLCFGLGWGNALWHQQIPSDHGIYAVQAANKGDMVFVGLVVSEVSHKTPQRSALTLRLERCAKTACTGKVQVFARQAIQAVYGQRLRLKGRLKRPANADNFAGFSYAKYLATQKIYGVVYAREADVEPLTEETELSTLQRMQNLNIFILRRFQNFRHRLVGAFEAHLPLGSARVLASLILGEQASPIPDAIKVKFQELGLQHVLAVSGYQVQLVVLTLVLVLRRLGVSQPLQMGVAILALWAFVLLTGAPASVLRAAAVATWICGARAFFRSQPILEAFACGVLCLLLFSPLLLWDIGFQFSAVATLGLILSAQPLQQKLSFLPVGPAAALGALFAAQIWVMPLQLLHFGSFSWLFLPGNLWAGLWSTLLTWGALAAALVMPLSAVLGISFLPCLAWGFMALDLGVQILLWGMDQLLHLPQPVLYFPRLSPAAMILCYLGLLGLCGRGMLRAFVHWRPYLLCVLWAIVLSLPALQGLAHWQEQAKCPLRVTYLAVGQGDASLIEVGGKAILMDAGPRWKTETGYDDAGRRAIVPYLRQRGLRQLHTVVLSHGHLDHYGGLLSIAEAVPIQRLLVPVGVLTEVQAEPHGSLGFMLRTLQAQGTQIETVNHGSFRDVAPGVRLLFWQPLGPEAGHNDSSLVMQMEHQAVRFLFAGDLEKAGEAALLQVPGFMPRTDILKVPHHGSSSSSTRAFLNALAPRDAIISVGERNRFRHPSPRVVDRYEQIQSRVWRTDQQGAVCVCSTGLSYGVQAKNAGAAVEP